MSDIRSFQVPAPQDDGGSDPGSGGSTGGQGRRSAPWPAPGRASAPGGSQPSWPEPPGPATSGGTSRRDAGDAREESPGEVTEWGAYPAYREPHPSGPHSGEPHLSGSHLGGPHSSGSHSSHDPLDLSKPLTPEPVPQEPSWSREEPAWAQDGPSWAQESWARESPWAQEGSTPQVPSWAAEAPTPPQGAPQAPSPRPDWAPPPTPPRVPPPGGAAPPQAPGRTPAPGQPRPPEESELPGRPRLPGEPQAPVRFPDTGRPPSAPRPRQEPRPSGERPFSYWERENTSRESEPSFWNQGPQAEQELRAEREREPVAEEESPAPPAKKKREPYLDNVKFVLIALVVTGHSLVPTLKAHSAESAYLYIYMFHMPAFVLISGYLGRNFWNSNAKINKLVDTLLIPYVVVEIGYALLRYGLGQKWTLTIIDPAWLNWYLLALVLWRISTPIWTRMRQPLLVAVVIYMAAGFSEISGDFSIDRFFGLLPFYVLGLLLKPEHFDLLKPLWVKITSAVVLVGAAVVAVVVAPRVPLDPIYFRYSFKAMDMSWWLGFGVRGAVLVAALVMTVAVLALVPRGETWFSDLGTRTLYAYLLHGVVVVIAKDQGWLSFPWLYGPLGVAAIASSSLALAIVLCLPETRRLFKWMLEPRLVWLYRRPSPPADTAAATTAPADAAPAAKESSASVTR
ncbi:MULTISPECIES: acyltransferase family protein [unclassified Streptosporangium]|uniref:acyltransferase family protein n=1 Tax=unclassified Streptosporangium TaxID=2632669 RepID=UPI002E29A591|nr:MULTISPECIES: acyltransferase family protein [unclassified Streptosporangium]